MKLSNLNIITWIAIVVMAILLFRQCSVSSNIKDELAISINNSSALGDSIETYRTRGGDLVYEKGILIASEKELKDLNKALYKDIKDLKNNPKVVIMTETIIIHDTTLLETEIIKYSDGSNGIKWDYDSVYSEGNFQRLEGITRFKIDSTGLHDVNATLNTNSFGMTFKTGITEEDGQYRIFVESDYPNFTVGKIEGAILDKSMIQSNESSWVAGPFIGYGLQFVNNNVTYGPQIGVAISYNFNKSIKKLFKR